jgi:hypothetical protein
MIQNLQRNHQAIKKSPKKTGKPKEQKTWTTNVEKEIANEAIVAAKQIQPTNTCDWEVEQCYTMEQEELIPCQ